MSDSCSVRKCHWPVGINAQSDPFDVHKENGEQSDVDSGCDVALLIWDEEGK